MFEIRNLCEIRTSIWLHLKRKVEFSIFVCFIFRFDVILKTVIFDFFSKLPIPGQPAYPTIRFGLGPGDTSSYEDFEFRVFPTRWIIKKMMRRMFVFRPADTIDPAENENWNDSQIFPPEGGSDH